MRGRYGIPWDIPGRIDDTLDVECGKAAVVRDRKLRDCAVRLRVLSAKRCLSDRYNSTHQSPRNIDPAYIAAATERTEQFRTVAHGREVRLPALVAQILETIVTCHCYILFPAASHYRTGVLSFFCPWDDRLPHPSSSGRSTTFNNIPLVPDQPDGPDQKLTKNVVRRLTTSCAHLVQVITSSIKPNHWHLVSTCGYGTHR